MKINKTNKVKQKNYNLSNANSNFQKINYIMNQRLDGLLDYLTASFYFYQYNIKNDNDEKNLKKFFKSKIFEKKPFIMKDETKLNNKKKERQNKKLNIIINIKDDKINNIMNQRLVGLFDYLAASVYFSKYNIKKVKDEKNLERFFKSKIFSKKPFIVKNGPNLNLSNKTKQISN